MGLFGDMLKGLRMQDPVRGQAQVAACTGYHGEGLYQNCSMNLIVQAPGVPATHVELSDLVHNKRWPSPGMTLPCTVDRANPQKVKIEWDEVEKSDDRAKRNAEAMAAAMRGQAPGGAGAGMPFAGGLGGGQVNVVNLSGRDMSQLSEEQKAKLRMLGIDPAMLAAQQGPTAPPPAAPPSAGPPPPAAPMPPPGAPMAPRPGATADDQLARLERLGALRQQGILTEAEFEQQKRRILGS